MIDKDGRIFGRFNIIDFFAVILLSLGILAAFYLHRIIKKPYISKDIQKLMVELELNCSAVKVKPEVVNLIAVGDKEISKDGTLAAEVIWLGTPQEYGYKDEIDRVGDSLRISTELKEVPMRLRINAEISDDGFYFHGKQIVSNAPMEFTTEKYSIKIMPAKKDDRMRDVELILDIVLKELDEGIINKIAIGDFEKDERGRVIAKILKIGDINQNSYSIDTGRGNFISAESVLTKQLFVKMAVKGSLTADRCLFFKGNKIDSDSWIDFKTDKYAVRGQLLDSYYAIQSAKEVVVTAEVKFMDIISEVVNSMAPGDVAIDTAGKKIGILNEIGELSPSTAIPGRRNRTTFTARPVSKNVLCKLELICSEKNNNLYYNNALVKMGNLINFDTAMYHMSGIIISVNRADQ